MTKSKAEIGVAFLGVGRMGETHLRNLAGINGVRVRVVADPILEAAEQGRELAGADRATANIDEAILDPAVDAVIIVRATDCPRSGGDETRGRSDRSKRRRCTTRFYAPIRSRLCRS